jgi:hypothetical protein
VPFGAALSDLEHRRCAIAARKLDLGETIDTQLRVLAHRDVDMDPVGGRQDVARAQVGPGGCGQVSSSALNPRATVLGLYAQERFVSFLRQNHDDRQSRTHRHRSDDRPLPWGEESASGT